jgi:hypothetical protein
MLLAGDIGGTKTSLAVFSPEAGLRTPLAAAAFPFLKDSGYDEEPAWLSEQLAAADDPTPIIVSSALDTERPCELCVVTLAKGPCRI